MPSAVRLASTLFVAYAVVGLIAGAAYWLLDGRNVVSWLFFGVLLVFAGIYIWIGLSLLRLRRGALFIGRVLGVLTGVGALGLIGSRPQGGQLLLTLLRWAQVVLALSVAVSLFMPGVDKAFKQPRRPARERYSR